MSTDPKKWAGKKLGREPEEQRTSERREASGEGISQDDADAILDSMDDDLGLVDDE